MEPPRPQALACSMTPTTPPSMSLNARAAALADALIAEAPALGIGVSLGPEGESLVDCGLRHLGSLEAGRQLARICLAGLAEVSILPSAQHALPWTVMVRTSHPVLACLASQYAGWHLKADDGSPLMGSGPARALWAHEPLFHDIPHKEHANRAVLVLEGDAAPGGSAARDMAQACGLASDRLTLIHAPTGSLAGTVQIAARVIECALQKARALHFDPGTIAEALGTAPLAPPHPDTRTAMGRANDAIIYGGRVHLFVTGDANAAKALAEALPSQTAPEWGRSFSEVFAEAEGNFAQIDPGLFSPAEVIVTALSTGQTFRAGRADPARLAGILDTS